MILLIAISLVALFATDDGLFCSVRKLFSVIHVLLNKRTDTLQLMLVVETLCMVCGCASGDFAHGWWICRWRCCAWLVDVQVETLCMVGG